MILNSTGRSASSPSIRLATITFFLAWTAFALTGAMSVQAGTSNHETLTDQAIQEHASRIVARIAQYPSADVDSDGKISFAERNAFLVTVLYSDPQRNLECFPYSVAFRGHDLELMNAYDVVRGLTYRTELEQKAKTKITAEKREGADEQTLKQIKLNFSAELLAATEVVLNGQEALLDRVSVEPPPEKVAAVQKKVFAQRWADEALKLKTTATELEHKIAALEEAGHTVEAEETRVKLEQIQKKLKHIKQQG